MISSRVLAVLLVLTLSVSVTLADSTPTTRGSTGGEALVSDGDGYGKEVEKDCCKICRKGKACGDSCISKNKVCTKPPGCACDAD